MEWGGERRKREARARCLTTIMYTVVKGKGGQKAQVTLVARNPREGWSTADGHEGAS